MNTKAIVGIGIIIIVCACVCPLPIPNIERFAHKVCRCTLIYIPWCKYCQQFMPVWNNVVTEFNGQILEQNVTLELDKIDANRNPEQVDSDVKEYPYVKIVRSDGTPRKFSGARTVEKISAWLMKNAG